MRLLAFDCAGDDRSAALLVGGRVAAARTESGPKAHAERLVTLLDALMAEAGTPWSAIDVLAVGHGPGSFTGIRVAVAAARGLALALDRPVMPVDLRDALLLDPATGPHRTVAAIDARRGGLYVAVAEGTAIERSPLAETPAAVASRLAGPLVVRGSGAAMLAEAAGARALVEPRAVRAPAIGRAALASLAAGAPLLAGHVVRPLYLRAPDAVPRAA